MRVQVGVLPGVVQHKSSGEGGPFTVWALRAGELGEERPEVRELKRNQSAIVVVVAQCCQDRNKKRPRRPSQGAEEWGRLAGGIGKAYFILVRPQHV